MAALPRPLVIWLHGLGDQGASFKFLSRFLPAGTVLRTPNAPPRPITVNGGAPMRGWMDVLSWPPGPDSKDDEEGLNASTKLVHELLVYEAQRHPEGTPIILGGFSQGAALSFYAGLQSPVKLAGILMVSGWPPLTKKATAFPRPDFISPANAAVPFFIAHSPDDATVPIAGGLGARDLLRGAGHNVTWMEFADGHTLNEEVVGGIQSFVKTIV